MSVTFSSPSTVVVSAHDGARVVARCLPCSQRRQFLALWEAAWERLKDSQLAQAASEISDEIGIAYLWDSDPDFQWLCLQMLSLHGIDGGQLDIAQVAELLFRTGDGQNGLLVGLQFPPLPPGVQGKEDIGDPYYRLMATIAFKSGDWAAAQLAMQTIPYDDVVNLCAELEKAYSESAQATPKATSKVEPTDALDKLEKVALADIQERIQKRTGAPIPSPMEAIAKAAQDKKPS